MNMSIDGLSLVFPILLCWLNEVFLYPLYCILGQLITPSVLLLSDFRWSSFSSCFSAVAFIDTHTAAHASLSAQTSLQKAWCLIQSLTVEHMINNKSKHFPNEHKSVRFFSSSKMCQVVPSLQLTVYLQHLDFHHTDRHHMLLNRQNNKHPLFSSLWHFVWRERTVTKAHGLVGHVFSISFLPPSRWAVRSRVVIYARIWNLFHRIKQTYGKSL